MDNRRASGIASICEPCDPDQRSELKGDGLRKLTEAIGKPPKFVIAAPIVVAASSAPRYFDSIESILKRMTPRPLMGVHEAPLRRALRLATSGFATQARAEVKTEVVSSFASGCNLRQEEVAQAADEFYRQDDSCCSGEIVMNKALANSRRTSVITGYGLEGFRRRIDCGRALSRAAAVEVITEGSMKMRCWLVADIKTKSIGNLH